MSLADQYYLKFAAAFVRGRALQGLDLDLPESLRATRLEELSGDQLVELFELGREAGLKLHKFKRTMGLARVQRVFGVLHSLAHQNQLDIGSGRGVFLWPLLDEFPWLPVTAVDHSPQRSADLQAVQLGGVAQLTPHQMDATNLEFEDGQFEVVTILEVLEHIPQVELAVAEVARVARRFVVLSVPSHEDDNPEHIHLLSQDRLRELFAAVGHHRVNFDYVPGHLIAVVNASR